MKVIVKNKKNVVECECGTIIEFEKEDCSLVFSDKNKGILQIVVYCPTCNKIHKTTVEDLSGLSIADVETKTKINNPTFKQIKENPNLVEIGYQKEVELKNGDKAVFEVVGRYHDIKTNGEKAGISFVLRDLLGKDDDENLDRSMNSNGSNKGGWEKCEMRKYLNEEVLALLPDDLVELIESVKKETYCDNKLVITGDKLWLLSEKEIFGKKIYSQGEEGEQYEFFKYYRNRIKGHSALIVVIYIGSAHRMLAALAASVLSITLVVLAPAVLPIPMVWLSAFAYNQTIYTRMCVMEVVNCKEVYLMAS